ncbi:MAG TPA: zinc ABC transporter substrate-binding protein [Candidatus Baltobacteraceae bacterium]|nr:zinc ABC transporter substrate-binding protein [Candidatus Baltobacteraceae bacterium]
MTLGLALLLVAACSGAATTSPTGSAPPAASTAPGASAGVTPVASGPPLAVMGTENFYADLLTEIGGSRVQATSLLNDPNADPHEFETSPQDAALVADARLVIVNGIGYDDFMQQLLGAAPDPTRVVINVQQLLGVGDDVNVHIWYDPGTMPKVAQTAAAALSRLDPANAAYYAANEQAYLASLQPLTTEIALLKSTYSGAPVAFTEPVAGYLAAAIGLQVLTPEGFQKAIEEGTDPAPADVAAEQDLLTGKKVRVLLYNSQVTSPITQQVHDLAVQNGIPVVGVAETMPPAYQHYVDWQLAQMQALQAALAQGS